MSPAATSRTYLAPRPTMRFHDDDGSGIDPELVRKPGLCLTCRKDGDASEEVLCTLTRAEQEDDEELRCDAYEPSGLAG